MAFALVRAVAASGKSSRLIEYFGAGGFSHFASIVDDETVIDARSDVISGIPAGVHYRPKSYLDNEAKWLDIRLDCTFEQRQDWIGHLSSQCGKPYDKWGIVNFATGQFNNRDWRDPSSWFCSELGIWALEQAGILPTLKTSLNMITPGTAAAICEAAGGIVVSSKGF